ncbi:MAG TPA: TonB-dependent receptor [Gemmatimonadales bacterium]|nr:TonB-dependent receptor [Gemmatimonadales bacterium]
MLLVLLATQSGAVTDTIAGTVTGDAGRPVAGAIVQATSQVTRASRSETSDALGRFTILFAAERESGGGGNAQYHVTAHYFGLVRARGVVWGRSREDRGAVTVRMLPAGLIRPIDMILNARDSLGLSADQVRRLQAIAAAGDFGTLPVLESARNVLTETQWTRLSAGPLVIAAVPVAIASRPQQSLSPPAPSVPPSPPAPPPQAAPPPQGPVARSDISLYTAVTTVYETNLMHAPAANALDAYGALVGAGGGYRGRWGHTTLEVHYDGVFRRYTGTDVWNVPGHQAGVAVAGRVARRWTVGVEGGMQINGSSEDRVLRNEYTAQGEIEYRVHATGRLQLYGEYMLKRYPVKRGNDAVDPRVGLKYREAIGTSGTWGIGARYNYNRADSSRYQYTGWTATTDFAFPLWKGGRISTNFRYNIRRYQSRMVSVNGVDVLRRDEDRVASVAWRQGITRLWDFVMGYRYEYYSSNDPDRTWRADMFAVTLNRFW